MSQVVQVVVALKTPPLCHSLAHLSVIFAAETANSRIQFRLPENCFFAAKLYDMTETVRMCDLRFDSSLFENYLTGTVLDRLLCSYSGLPKGVNYMVIVYAVEWHSCVLFLQAKKRKEYAEQKYFVCLQRI